MEGVDEVGGEGVLEEEKKEFAGKGRRSR